MLRFPVTALAAWIVCCAGVVHGQDAAPRQRAPGVAIEPAVPWAARHWSGAQLNTEQVTSDLDFESHAARFAVHDPGKAKVWTYYLAQPVDWHANPIVVIRYRATNAGKPGYYLLWLDGGGGPDAPQGGKSIAATPRDVVADGQEHELRRDLRQLNFPGEGKVVGMALGVSCSPESMPGTFELLSLRFEPAEGQEAAPEPDAEANWSLPVLVRDGTGQPIEGAAVTVDAEFVDLARSAVSDGTGLVTVEGLVTIRDGKHLVRVSKKGMATIFASVEPDKLDGGQLVVMLHPTQQLSGQVVDEAGEPIAGAGVMFWAMGRTRPQTPGVYRWHDIAPRTVSDADGRFTVTAPDDGTEYTPRVVHGRYLGDQWGGQTFKPTLAQLRDGTARCVMRKGFVVAGVVVDPDGNPAPNATVAQGTDQFPSNAPPVTRTGEDGAFRFENTRPGELVLTARSAKFGPATLRRQLSESVEDLRLVLSPPSVVRFRVVDEKGEPLQGARVLADTWRGLRTLGWSGTTDKDGRVEWKAAPPDAVLYDILIRDRMSVRRLSLTPGETEHVITLPPLLHVNGSVTDAATGKPIERFTVIPGLQFDGNASPHWQRRSGRVFTDGQYEWKASYPYDRHLVRIEAEGYSPAVSRPIASDEGRITIDFTLTEAETPTGTVLSPDGQPARAAVIYVATPGQGVYLQNGRMPYDQGNITATTDEQGKFTLPLFDPPFVLVAVHDAGYAEVTDAAWPSAPTIQLEVWARVEGVLRVGDKPGVGEKLQIWHERPHDEQHISVYNDLSARADEQGRFVFERVQPGAGGVSRYIQLGPNTWGGAISVRLELAAGKTAHVELGGTGRPIIGRVVLPPDADRSVTFGYGHRSLMTRVEPIKPPFPDDWATMDDDQKRTWFEAWRQTDDGRTFAERQRDALRNQRHFGFAMNADGSFRIEDVPPGEYLLAIQVADPPTTSQCGPGEHVGTVNHRVTVPPMEKAYEPEPLDLGELALLIRKTLKVGDAAPDFEVPTLDGKTIRLSDYRGKVVLLDFWATWCGPCVAEVPHLKPLHERYASDDRFVMISLSLDDKMDAPRKFVEANHLGWTQAFLGSWSADKVTETYGVEGIPALFVIGPDGKVAAKGVRGSATDAAVAAALATAPARAAN